ncbi:hypothetical protein K439DRAFT_1625681 [Ramaria rubella]|nr:hypothetical protein K439DRAFT_1625681 [Ramaria rubella]
MEIDPQWSSLQVSQWILDLFPDVWKHLETVAAVRKGASSLYVEDEGEMEPELPPWVLFHTENWNFAIVKTKEVGPEGWDLVQVKSKGCSTTDDVMLYLGTRIPIPAEVYKADKWWEWENAPSLYKPQGRKGRKRSRCFTDSDEEEVLEQTNPSKKPKAHSVLSKGKQPEVLGSSDHEEEDDIVLVETDTDEPLPEPKLLALETSLYVSHQKSLQPPCFSRMNTALSCLPSLCPPSTALVASTSLTKLSDTNHANRKPYQALFAMDHDLWDEPVPLENISF